MLKKVINNIIIGVVIMIVGSLIYNLVGIRQLGEFVIWAGIFYGILSVGIISLKQCIPFFNKIILDRESAKAQDELLKYKKLLDEGILTQDEFDEKANNLKKKLL
ncbi:SHOCT domain-containing protein [Moritella sp. 24]|uniref:SHOCT domain-containing protein n=1 Tax=Moritella sp. 24 TaxID=2746230 RepID=UPI001BA582DA|nr:SHOCT domain-containing protein [Moritella sp. 24]QUM74778.1 SHOCT domain-containing protein [Moritella sp. 24]